MNNIVITLERTKETVADMSDVLVIDFRSITPYPAATEEYGAKFKDFGGYRVDLAPFRSSYCGIRFRGVGNGTDVMCGYIVDKDGCIESVARLPCDDSGHAILPLTPRSHALYASVPTKLGKPVWERITVEFILHRRRSIVRPQSNTSVYILRCEDLMKTPYAEC